MISNILITVDDINYIDDYRKANVKAFLFPLDNYCVGYKTYSIDIIKSIDVSNKYLLLNRVLDCKDIDNLKIILNDIEGIKGIVFEDIGVYNLVKELNLNIELILFQNHFATNSISVNYWLDRVDSIILSNEITGKQIRNIVSIAKKGVCIHLYGYNQVMYSRRLLLKNWSDEFNIPYKNNNVISDVSTNIKFRAIENEYGTVMYSENIYNASTLLDLENVKYFYVNPTMIEHSRVMEFLNGDNNIKENEDDGFLNKKTIYKLKGGSK